jgi:hypothetical protein
MLQPGASPGAIGVAFERGGDAVWRSDDQEVLTVVPRERPVRFAGGLARADAPKRQELQGALIEADANVAKSLVLERGATEGL